MGRFGQGKGRSHYKPCSGVPGWGEPAQGLRSRGLQQHCRTPGFLGSCSGWWWGGTLGGREGSVSSPLHGPVTTAQGHTSGRKLRQPCWLWALPRAILLCWDGRGTSYALPVWAGPVCSAPRTSPSRGCRLPTPGRRSLARVKTSGLLCAQSRGQSGVPCWDFWPGEGCWGLLSVTLSWGKKEGGVG